MQRNRSGLFKKPVSCLNPSYCGWHLSYKLLRFKKMGGRGGERKKIRHPFEQLHKELKINGADFDFLI